MKAIVWIKNHLDSQEVGYRHLHHQSAFSAKETAEREHVSGNRVAKTVLVMADGRPVVLVLPVTRRVCLDRVLKQLGAEIVRLASDAESKEHFADCEPGAVPPLRHWNGADLLVDPSMKVKGELLFYAGSHSDLIRLSYDDWFRVAQPRVAHFAADPNSEEAYHCARAQSPAERFCAAPSQLAPLLADLLDVLNTQAEEIQRLSEHVEQHARPLPKPSRMPLCVAELGELRARLNDSDSTDESGRPAEESEKPVIPPADCSDIDKNVNPHLQGWPSAAKA